jgi:hypothetical protein
MTSIAGVAPVIGVIGADAGIAGYHHSSRAACANCRIEAGFAGSRTGIAREVSRITVSIDRANGIAKSISFVIIGRKIAAVPESDLKLRNAIIERSERSSNSKIVKSDIQILVVVIGKRAESAHIAAIDIAFRKRKKGSLGVVVGSGDRGINEVIGLH